MGLSDYSALGARQQADQTVAWSGKFLGKVFSGAGPFFVYFILLRSLISRAKGDDEFGSLVTAIATVKYSSSLSEAIQS